MTTPTGDAAATEWSLNPGCVLLWTLERRDGASPPDFLTWPCETSVFEDNLRPRGELERPTLPPAEETDVRLRDRHFTRKSPGGNSRVTPGEKASEMPDFGHPEYRSPGSHVEMLPGSPGGHF